MRGSRVRARARRASAPGEQALIRRRAYAALQDMFEANDIKLATPHMVVNSAAAGANAAESVTGPPPAVG